TRDTMRYARKDELGEWCSRACRGDTERVAIRKCGRPRKYRTLEECGAAKTSQQRAYRSVAVWKNPLAAWQKQRAYRRENRLFRIPLRRTIVGTIARHAAIILLGATQTCTRSSR